MKLKHTSAKKTAEEVKKLAEYFESPVVQVLGMNRLMDWSEDIPEVQSSPAPCISPAGEHVSLPHVPSIIGTQSKKEG